MVAESGRLESLRRHLHANVTAKCTFEISRARVVVIDSAPTSKTRGSPAIVATVGGAVVGGRLPIQFEQPLARESQEDRLVAQCGTAALAYASRGM